MDISCTGSACSLYQKGVQKELNEANKICKSHYVCIHMCTAHAAYKYSLTLMSQLHIYYIHQSVTPGTGASHSAAWGSPWHSTRDASLARSGSQLPAMRKETPSVQWVRADCILDYWARPLLGDRGSNGGTGGTGVACLLPLKGGCVAPQTVRPEMPHGL